MSTTVVVVAQVPMTEQVEAQPGVRTVSAAAVADGTAAPRGRGASHRALTAVHKSPLLLPGQPRSHSSSLAKTKVGNTIMTLNAVQ